MVEMDMRHEPGLEFDFDTGDDGRPEGLEGRETELQKIIRQGFRAPVELSRKMRLVIDGVSYAVFNLSGNGIGIYLNEQGGFTLKTKLSGMQFAIDGQTFLVDGVVVHRASDGAQDLCGIEITAMSPECQEAILDYLKKSRSSLFS